MFAMRLHAGAINTHRFLPLPTQPLQIVVVLVVMVVVAVVAVVAV